MAKFEVITDINFTSWYRRYEEVEADSAEEARAKVKAKYDAESSLINIDECKCMDTYDFTFDVQEEVEELEDED